MNSANQRLILGFILLFGFCARAATFKSPILDHHSWRQADTAAIARNFATERFHILYPQVDWRGSRADGYVETGLEAVAFIAAAISKVTGFHPHVGRLVSTFVFLASALLVWIFVKRRCGDAAGLVAAFLYTFGFPLSLYIERAFMNEALLICLALLCLVAAQRYLDEPRGRRVSLALLLGASSLIAMIKPPYLIVWAAVGGLFVEKRGARVWRSWELGLLSALSLLAAVAWYRHAHALGAATGLSFGITDKLFDAELVFSTRFVNKILIRLVKDVLDPVGFAAVLAGTWLAIRRKRWAEPLGVLAFIAYMIVAAKGNFAHNYYQLAIVPIAPAAAAPAFLELAGVRATHRLFRYRHQLVAVLLALAAFSTFVRSTSFHSWYEYGADLVLFCDASETLVRPDERVVFIASTDPALLFCMNRKGWLLTDAESHVGRIKETQQKGARLAVVRGGTVSDDVWRFLNESGTLVFSAGVVRAYRLPPPPASPASSAR